MTDGVKIRAEIDAENAKGLFLINGGSATAILAFLTQVFEKSELLPFARASLYSLTAFLCGVVFAFFHNVMRRKCSLRYEQNEMRAPAGERLFGIKFAECRVCFSSRLFFAFSVIAFCVGGLFIIVGGFIFADAKAAGKFTEPTSKLEKVSAPNLEKTSKVQ